MTNKIEYKTCDNCECILNGYYITYYSCNYCKECYETVKDNESNNDIDTDNICLYCKTKYKNKVYCIFCNEDGCDNCPKINMTYYKEHKYDVCDNCCRNKYFFINIKSHHEEVIKENKIIEDQNKLRKQLKCIMSHTMKYESNYFDCDKCGESYDISRESDLNICNSCEKGMCDKCFELHFK